MKMESLYPNMMGMGTNYIPYTQLTNIFYNMNKRKLIVTSLTVIDDVIRINAYQEGENPNTAQEIVYNGTLQDIYNEVTITKTIDIVEEANNYKWNYLLMIAMTMKDNNPEVWFEFNGKHLNDNPAIKYYIQFDIMLENEKHIVYISSFNQTEKKIMYTNKIEDALIMNIYETAMKAAKIICMEEFKEIGNNVMMKELTT